MTIERSEAKYWKRKIKSHYNLDSKAIRGDSGSICQKQWLNCALEGLVLNNVDIKLFAKCIRESLLNWHGKFRNMILVGPSKCSKTYTFKPLTQSFKSKIISHLFQGQIWFGRCWKIQSNFATGIQVTQRINHFNHLERTPFTAWREHRHFASS